MRPSPISTLSHPLDEVLGTRSQVRVVRVLAVHGGSLAVADIARRAKLTLPSVRGALRRLLDIDVVTAIGAGRSMVCGLRQEHPLVSALMSLVAAEQEQATAVFRAVRETAGQFEPAPWAVWFTNSIARGEDNAASDIAIALVMASAEQSACADALRDAVSQTSFARAERVSVITMAPTDVCLAAREKAPFWEALQRDAIVLLGDTPAGLLERAGRERGE